MKLPFFKDLIVIEPLFLSSLWNIMLHFIILYVSKFNS